MRAALDQFRAEVALQLVKFGEVDQSLRQRGWLDGDVVVSARIATLRSVAKRLDALFGAPQDLNPSNHPGVSNE